MNIAPANDVPGEAQGSCATRVLRRSLFVLACLATLIALAYAVENWRGKQVWEKQKRALEAKGELLDWAAYIPAPVPDEQNSFKAPRITEWFVKGAGSYTNELSHKLSVVWPSRTAKTGSVTLAELRIVPSASDADATRT